MAVVVAAGSRRWVCEGRLDAGWTIRGVFSGSVKRLVTMRSISTILYLTLIRAIALLHQHQRPIRSATVVGRELRYIEVTADDVRLANRLAHAVLGRSLDELPPGTRRLLGLIEAHVAQRAQEDGQPRERVCAKRWGGAIRS